MTITVTSQPIDAPAGLRLTMGTITFDTSYPTGGEPVTAAQFGAAGVGHSRLPDFVLFNNGRALDAADSDASLLATYTRNGQKQGSNAAGTVQLFGDTATEGTGLDEIDSTVDASTVVVDFLAIWVNPATVTSA